MGEKGGEDARTVRDDEGRDEFSVRGDERPVGEGFNVLLPVAIVGLNDRIGLAPYRLVPRQQHAHVVAVRGAEQVPGLSV